MFGIDLEKEITFMGASLRFFEKNERHVSRFCHCDVLLLVYEGVLRFSEDGVPVEVKAGEYYVQKANCYQSGEAVSDAPKYLYVHFLGNWSEGSRVLPQRGIFNYSLFAPLMNELDLISRGNFTYTEMAGKFFILLSVLYRSAEKEKTFAEDIAEYIEREYLNISSLEDICAVFHYSKNHIINVFKAEYGMTPFEYINDVKIKRGMYLLEVTSRPIDEISQACGFNNYSHFYRLFVRKNSISPFGWRERSKMISDKK